MKRVVLLGTLIAAGAAGIAAGPRNQNQDATLEKVHDNLYVIRGGGGNTAAFVTADGVVLVDTKLAGWGERIMQQVRSVTDKPVTTIINTHTHGDHVGSNEYFRPTVQIVAHDNTRANMERMEAFQGEKAKFLPGRTYRDTLTLGSGGDRVDLYYFGPGHTNGDTIVVFPALRAAHTGDLFAGPATPIIDTRNGGSGIGYPETLKKAASGISGVETVIPGHADVTTWDKFVEFGAFNAAFLAEVQRGVQAGKTPEQIAKELTLPDKFKDYGMGRAQANITTISNEIKR